MTGVSGVGRPRPSIHIVRTMSRPLATTQLDFAGLGSGGSCRVSRQKPTRYGEYTVLGFLLDNIPGAGLIHT